MEFEVGTFHIKIRSPNIQVPCSVSNVIKFPSMEDFLQNRDDFHKQ